MNPQDCPEFAECIAEKNCCAEDSCTWKTPEEVSALAASARAVSEGSFGEQPLLALSEASGFAAPVGICRRPHVICVDSLASRLGTSVAAGV